MCKSTAPNDVVYLSANHITSIEAASRGGSVVGTRRYNAFGASRGTTGTMPTERGFTGRPHDATGLVYMNARYYDPAIGQFISPDTVVPDPTVVMDYNRYAYARANPLKYNDSTGHAPQHPGDSENNPNPCATDWCWQNRWYRAHGKQWNGEGWGGSHEAVFYDDNILTDVLSEANISLAGSWTQGEAVTVGQAVIALATRVGGTEQLARLLSLQVIIGRQAGGCNTNTGCAFQAVTFPIFQIGIYDGAFFPHFGTSDLAKGVVVHELAHIIDFASRGWMGCAQHNAGCHWGLRFNSISSGFPHEGIITDYGTRNRTEYWAEAVSRWVYGYGYQHWETVNNPLTVNQTVFLETYLR